MSNYLRLVLMIWRVRDAQRAYFKGRGPRQLAYSLKLEADLDAYIKVEVETHGLGLQVDPDTLDHIPY